MKILLFGEIYPDSFARNILVTFRAMGHECTIVEHALLLYEGSRWKDWLRFAFYLRRLFPSIEEQFCRVLVKRAAETQPDLVLLLRKVPPATVRSIKEATRARVAFWFPDAISNLGRSEVLMAPLDVLFFKDPFMAKVFREKLDLNSIFLPEACNPMWHKPVEISADERSVYETDLAIVANPYPYRTVMLESLMEFRMKFWGGDWPLWLQSPIRQFHQKHYVAEEEKSRAFNAAKIVLNNLHFAEKSMNARSFEAAGCGAFQIMDRQPDLQDFFVPEEEVVTFDSLDELKTKIRFYLRHDSERERIARRGFERAHRDHTYERRLSRMLEVAFN
jgi:spore maturation protein CgeB